MLSQKAVKWCIHYTCDCAIQWRFARNRPHLSSYTSNPGAVLLRVCFKVIAAKAVDIKSVLQSDSSSICRRFFGMFKDTSIGRSTALSTILLRYKNDILAVHSGAVPTLSLSLYTAVIWQKEVSDKITKIGIFIPLCSTNQGLSK